MDDITSGRASHQPNAKTRPQSSRKIMAVEDPVFVRAAEHSLQEHICTRDALMDTRVC